MKYNSLIKKIGNDTFVFITRGRSKPFTDNEASAYLKEYMKDFETLDVNNFTISNEVSRVFLADIRQFSIDFCINKYGGTREEIISEAQRLAPYMRYENK